MKLVDIKLELELQACLWASGKAVGTSSGRIKDAIENLITPSETLETSSNKYANALYWLTAGLIFAGLSDVTLRIFFKI